jgi:diguanylate cyclase (GGDEF)-like protein
MMDWALSDVALEAVRAATLSAIIGLLWWRAGRRAFGGQAGHLLLLAGFSLILFGTLVDITSNFKELDGFVIVGDTKGGAVLEKGVGYLGGSLLVALGFWRWLPLIGERERSEAELRRAHTELAQRNEELLDARAEATTDALTALGNHRAFQERVRSETERCRQDGCGLVLIMLDVDFFKRVNDSLGHQIGDQVLRDVALMLGSVVRRGDAYRYGGDEFAVLLPGGDRQRGAQVAERLRHVIEGESEEKGIAITASLGVACYPGMAETADELIYGADIAMYWAKAAGKNRVGYWDRVMKGGDDEVVPWHLLERGIKAPDAVAALLAAQQAKDPLSTNRTERCSWYASTVAGEMGLSEEEVATIRLAALLHDIGNLAVPDIVLGKRGPLDQRDWAFIRRHPEVSVRIIGHIRPIAEAKRAILHHHERFDGNGYPDGLAAEDIPIGARILHVVDAFLAMTEARSYRKAMPVETAIEELKRQNRRQFDPIVVEAFLRVLLRQWAEPLCEVAPSSSSAGDGKTPAT